MSIIEYCSYCGHTIKLNKISYSLILADVGMQHKTGEVDLNFSTLQACQGKRKIELTNKMWRLLATLISFEGKCVSREDLIFIVFESTGTTRSVDTFVALIRKLLGPCIQTHHGKGYSWSPKPNA
jgi:DNA-binding response OmpR family regulator